MNEIIFIDKPKGITSFGAVSRVRRVLSEKAGKKVKVGHTGTLDPFATGLLILMAGQATKRCSEFMKLDKEYIAEIRLGETSTTGDPEGIVQKSYTGEPVAEGVIKKVVQEFIGEIEQTVPAFSAVRIKGQRAYDLARKGIKVEMPTRKVHIYNIEILDYDWPILKIRTSVSSGTYIRALGEDIGKKLGTGAYLTSLRRTKIDKYSVDEATPLEEFEKM
ncbi:tRNA pseudouridine(55) synthase TruB [Candidatus Saccharibacteria bacterium]|nr:tRNA pseudouridine(55) synthase TruB [Candidatus Saccharibacteria bacterium]